MPSETIWSSASGSSTPPFRTVLDQVDPSVAKYFANSSASSTSNHSNMADSIPHASPFTSSLSEGGRRFSFNNEGELDLDIDRSLFGLKKVSGSLLAITAPGYQANQQPGATTAAAGANRLNFGTASISAGIASRHPHPDSFLRKFQSVADATRDIELGTSALHLDTAADPEEARRLAAAASGAASAAAAAASFAPARQPPSQPPLADVLSSPHGSLNEPLNGPIPTRTSRHQSISEKIDNYNNNSPIQASATLSTKSDASPPHLFAHPDLYGQAPPAGAAGGQFWNPATATSFIPGGGAYFMDNGFYGRGAANTTMSPPPFMVPTPPPPQFIDPSIYEMMYAANTAALNGGAGAVPGNVAGPGNAAGPKDELTSFLALSLVLAGLNLALALSAALEVKQSPQKNSASISGIGLMNRPPPAGGGFMFSPHFPYPMYGQMAPGPSPPQPHGHQQAGAKQSDVPAQRSSPSRKKGPKGAATGSSGSTGGAGSGNAGGKAGAANSGSNGNSGGNHIYRSPLLEEVRSNFKGKEYFLKDIYGHAVEFTKDQHGSRFIQQQLPSASDEEKEVIFNEIRDISYELMTDVFGNYVIQKYFEFGSMTQKKVLLEYMIGHIYELSLQMYGCRVVQRALEAIELADQIRIIEELRDYVLVCAKDQNGNHVIQKSIERIPFEHITFILASLDNQIYHLSTHPYGCRVIQRLLEHSFEEDQTKILNELNRFIFYLIQDQYGNYVMQHILERGNPKDREAILSIVLGSVVQFSKHKFASNVIEKCIKFGTLSQRKRILHEVMIDNENIEDDEESVVSDASPLALMMKDQYANYVIQKLVEGFDAKSDEKKLLVTKLRQYLKQISSKNTYGKHLASVEKMIIVAETALVEANKH